MTLDQLTQRDRRIAELEAIRAGLRTAIEQRELGRLLQARDAYWRRLPEALENARRRAHTLEFYARQIGLPFTTQETV